MSSRQGGEPTPRRRDLLVGAGAAAATLLAGCSESGAEPNGTEDGAAPEPSETATATRTYRDPKPNLDVTSFTPKVEDGQPVVNVTVKNVGDEQATGTLVVATTVDDETIEREQSVSLDPGASRTYTLSFDLSAERISDIDAIDFTWKSATEP
jgi:hypothetical protein